MSYPVNLIPIFDQIIKKHAEVAINVFTNFEETTVSVQTDKARRTYKDTDSKNIIADLEQFLEDPTFSKMETV